MYVKSSVLLSYFLWWKSQVAWFLKCSSNVVSLIPKYLLSGLLGADTAVLYTMLAVKILLSRDYLAMFLQLHP